MHSLYISNTVSTSDNWDLIYKKYLEEILNRGSIFEGRNGETRSVFGCSVTVDAREGVPITTLRKLPFKNLIREFLFDIGTNTNVEALGKAKHFWDFLADEDGWLGASAYNRQWRTWPASLPGSEIPNERLTVSGVVDQFERVRKLLIDTPNSRHGTIITTNPTAIDPACPPCHLSLQFMPNGKWLDVMIPARSNDMVVGFPLDIARYTIILECMARLTGFAARYVYMPSTNSHIYENCYSVAKDMIVRTTRSNPRLIVKGNHATWDDFVLDDFELEGYDPHDSIKVGVN
jgi:thymidylate synthase